MAHTETSNENGLHGYSVTGKTAIVTGAGSGINLEFAALLLDRGCNVVFADLALRPEAQTLVELHGKASPRAVFAPTNVTEWGDLSRVFDIAQNEFGSIDLVCPGAGVFEPLYSNFWQPPGTPPSKDPVSGLGHYGTLDINVTHPIRMTQLAISHFLNPKKGGVKASPANPKRIVHIASIASEISLIISPLYIASKWAISGFVRSMDSLEATHGIRVNAVAPGIVKTPLWTSTEQAHKIAIIDETKDTWVTTTEVALAMLKLVEDPQMVGGTVLEIGHEKQRMVPLFMSEGPSGPGMGLSNAGVGIDELHRWIDTPGWGQV